MELDQKISDEFSFEKEKAIAKSLSQRFQWEMIAIGMGQATIFLSLWPLTLMGYMPLWAGFLVATLCACMAYLPSHEAQHGNYSRGNPKRRWIDSLVGNFTLITLIYPYEILRVTHMKHHAYTNHPKKDPDYDNQHASSVAKLAIQVLDGTSVDYSKYEEVFAEDAAFQKGFKKGALIGLTYRAVLMIAVFLLPLHTLFLWWLPAKLGTVYTTTFFSWYPHLKTEQGRYKDTRFWQHWMPRYINHSMQLHFIHHLHPSIGHFDEPKAIEALRPFLIARGVPGAEEIPQKIQYNPLIKV
jgi:beta-carotene hydroxylase